MKKIFIVCCFFIFIADTNTYAQFDKHFVNKYIQADYLIHKENYLGALKILLELYENNMDNPNVNFLVGACYMNLNQIDKAEPFLWRAFPHARPEYNQLYNDTIASMFTYFYLGIVSQTKYRFNEAIYYFNLFKYYLMSEYAFFPRYIDFVYELDRWIETCHNARRHIAYQKKIIIENIGPFVNTEWPEYAPIVSSDMKTLYFTTRRPENEGGMKDVDDKFFEDIYYATYDDVNEVWKDAKNLGTNINTKGHEATVSLSHDGKTLFLYRDDKGVGNVYKSTVVDNDWSKPQKLNINTSNWEPHACLSPDGKTLYFVSNRPGGLGGTDIYKSALLPDGSWDKPENLGPIINTKYDEESPFMLADGKTIYFSSKGHDSMGGYDVFTSTLDDEGNFSTPENLGFPINTTEDDVFFFPTTDPNVIYYSSAKKSDGYGDMDIYRITIIEDLELIAILKGNVFDELFFRPVSAEIKIAEIDGKYNAKFNTYQKTGEYYTNLPIGRKYQITVTAEGFDTLVDFIEVKESDRNQVFLKMYLMKKPRTDLDLIQYVIEEVELDSIPKPLYFEDMDASKMKIGDRIILKNIFYDFDKSTLRQESIEELEKLTDLLQKRPTMRIEISGHTDNKGSARYNKKLSEDRAKSVVTYLTGKGIDLGRLEAKGYGFDEPIATNDTEEGRQMNRRTEFMVIGL